MNRVAAVARLTRYCQPLLDPTLTTDDLNALLDEHAVTPDADGLAPADAGWTETFGVVGVWIAAAAAWDMKAAKAAGRFDFTTDGQQFRRSQVIAHCHEQADRYRRKASLTTTVRGS